MFFTNLKLYRLTQALPFTVEELATALATKPARACANQELSTYGFVAPIGKGDDAPLVHVSGDFLLLATRKEERILPGSVVNDALREKVEEIETDQARKVYKRERDQIKDDIIQTFLPRAFVRRASTFAAIDLKQGLIIVNTGSPRAAEDLLSTIRECVGSLPVRPVTAKIAPTATLTEWLKTEEAAPGFYVLDECELRDSHEDGGTVRCKRQDLTAEEFKMHLATGKLATKLSISWDAKLSFIVDTDLTVRRVKFEDLLKTQAEQEGGDDALAQLDASFTLMMLTFAEFIPALLEAFGGEELPGEAVDSQAAAVITSFDPAGPKRDHTVTFTATPAEDVDGEEDELLPEAIAFVRQSQRASISAVQRRLMIGYNRAARIMEAMEIQGIVSPMHTNGSRTVLPVPA